MASLTTQNDNVSVANPQPDGLQEWEKIVADKKQRSQNDIPDAWKLPESILSELSLPLESHPNRILDLDIPRKSGILSTRELEITENFSVAELLERLASGNLTSLEVTTAFCKRAAIAQQLVSTTGEASHGWKCLVSNDISYPVSPRYSLQRHLNAPQLSMRSAPRETSLWAHCMDFPSASRTPTRSRATRQAADMCLS